MRVDSEDCKILVIERKTAPRLDMDYVLSEMRDAVAHAVCLPEELISSGPIVTRAYLDEHGSLKVDTIDLQVA